MPYPNSNYVDGLQAVVALSVYCYNNGATYMTYNGDPSPGAAQTELRNSDNQLIGSVTYADGRKGNLSLQYALAVDEIPGANNLLQPGFIVSFRQRFFVVGAVKTPIEKNQVIKFAPEITEIQNPVLTTLLTLYGQQYLQSVANGALPITKSCAASGTRSGATLVYSAETFATPSSAAPSGITINVSSGLLTIANTVTAGTYDVRVVVTDTVTLPDGSSNTVAGFGRYTLTVT